MKRIQKISETTPIPIESQIVNEYNESKNNAYSCDYINNNMSGSSGDERIFYWDGQSSDANPNNIELWQKVVDKSQKSEFVVVISKDYSSSSDINKAIFILNDKTITSSTTSKKINSFMSYGATISDANGVGFNNYMPSTQITLSNLKVTSVQKLSTYDIGASYHYLPTNSNKVTSYEPTYDYHPASKKYVDDAVGDISKILDSINGEVV